MKMGISCRVLMAAMLMGCVSLWGQTHVGGNIAEDTTWNAAGSPYIVDSSVIVNAGVTLTVEPGVTVQVLQNQYIKILGTLNAQGTSGARIVFTGTTETAGWWNSIYIQDAGAATLAYCDIGYGGYWEGINVYKSGTGAFSAVHCNFHHSSGDGLRINGSSGAQTLSNNHFANNNSGARIGVGMSFDDSAATFSDNSVAVYADGGNIATNAVWAVGPAYSLYASGPITVDEGASLTVRAGTVTKMAQNSYLAVNGTLTVNGTADAPVYFTDVRDDSVGDNRHNVDPPAPNWWNCLHVQNAGTATLDYCVIRYTGYWEGLGLWKQGTGNLTLRNSTVAYSSGHGLKISSSTGAHVVTDCTFANNGSSGFFLDNSQATVTGCHFNNNSTGFWQTPSNCIDYAANSFSGNTGTAVGVSGGNIAADVTWGPGQGDGTFRVDGSVVLNGDIKLTVLPGTTIKVNQNCYIQINGALTARGTETLPIVFTGLTETPNWWNSVYIQGAGSADLAHCSFGYGGYWEGANVYKTGAGAFSAAHCSFHHSSGDGLRLNGSSGAQTLTNNSFSYNNYGVRMSSGMSFDDAAATFTGNNTAVYVDGGNVATNAVWAVGPAYSLYASGSLTVDEGASLTVKSGTVVKMAQNSYLAVNGTLNVNGTADAPVYFTDLRDDTVGEDRNGDPPAPNWWNCIHVQNAGTATMDHCVVRYTGYWESLGLWKQGTGNLTLRNSTIAYSSGHGLKIGGSAGNHVITDCTFANNGNSGFFLDSSLATVTGCHFNDNIYGFRQTPSNYIDYAANSFSGNSGAAVCVNGGNIVSDVTWGPGQGDGTFRVDGSVILNGDIKLNVLPGTTVKTNQNCYIQINGALTARGSATSPIVFTGTTESPNWWNSVYIQGAGSADLAHCSFGYGGYWEGTNVYKTGTGAFSAANCSFHHSSGDGLRINGSSGAQTLSNNSFYNNNYGARIGVGMSFDDAAATFASNNINVYADGGDINTNVIWNVGSAYSLYQSGSIAINAGASLTVKPGTVVKIAQNCYTAVYGTLSAPGTAEAPIYFTDFRDDSVGGDANRDNGVNEPAPGWWNCVHIMDNGVANFDHTTIRYGGYWENLCVWKQGAGDLTLNNSTVSRSSGHGLKIDNSTGKHTLSASVFSDNGNAGFLLNNSQATVNGCLFTRNGNVGMSQTPNVCIDYPANFFTDNANAAVEIQGGNVSADVTWAPGQGTDASFRVVDTVTVDEGKTLNLQAGTTVKMCQYRAMVVNGALVGTGTSGSPVRFTGTTEMAGWWNSIYIQNAGSATLDFCDIAYGGYWEGTNLFKKGSGDLTLSNCNISHSYNRGLTLSGSSGKHDIGFSAFTTNGTGVYVTSAPEGLEIHNCSFTSNSDWGFYNTGEPTVDARGNWWGSATGPQHASNPSGTGDKVSDYVLFEPWKNDQTTSHILAPMRSGEITAGDTLNFIGQQPSVGEYGYYWTLGQGRTSTLQNPGMVTFAGADADTEAVTTFAVVDAEGTVDSYPDSRTYTVKPNTGDIPDLKVATFNVPANLQVGQIYQLAYTASNIGKGPIANRSWRDAVYLSKDAYLDASDTLLAMTDLTAKTVEVGASYESEINTYIPAVTEGQSYLILSLDDTWKVLEEHQLNNEFASSSNLGVTSIASGETITGSFGVVSTPLYYKVTATQGQGLFLRFSGNVIVYVMRGGFPTQSLYSYRATLAEGGKLTIPALAAGDWYIMVVPDPGAGATDFSLTPTLSGFLLTGSSPSKCSTAEAIVLNISGVGFADGFAAELIGSTGTAYPAGGAEATTYSQATATFAAGSVPAGTYTLRISQPGATDAELADALTVTAEGKAELSVKLVIPERMGYHQLATIYVDYANIGDAPMPTPMLILTALQNDKQGALLTLDKSRLTAGFWTSSIPDGFSNQVGFLAAGALPGTLQAGESKRVPVYYAGWQQPWDFTYPPFKFVIGAVTTDNTQVVDWASMEEPLRPPKVSAAAWNAVWKNVVAQTGSSYGQFVERLNATASHLYNNGQGNIIDISQLLRKTIQSALGLNRVDQIAASVDAGIENGGSPLIFQRIYNNGILWRYRLGAFGRGWAHYLECSLETDTEGNVTIYQMDTPYIFQPDSRGGYFGPSGCSLSGSGSTFTMTQTNGMKYNFASGSLSSIENAAGFKTTLSYTDGKLTAITGQTGHGFQLVYSGDRISSIADSFGRRTQYAYDATGEYLVSVTFPDTRTATYAYDTTAGSASLHAMTRAEQAGLTQEMTYDANGKLASISAANGYDKATFAYDSFGNVIATNSSGSATRINFDHKGQVIKAADSANSLYYFYDSSNQFAGILSATGLRYQVTRDNSGNISAITDPLGNVENYGNDSFGQISSITDAKGNKTNFNYNGKGQLLNIVYPDHSTEAFAYDDDGRISSADNRRGTRLHYTYDDSGYLAKLDAAGVTIDTCARDAFGNISSFADATGSTTMTYDSKQRVTQILHSSGVSLTYTYDAEGRRASVTDHLGNKINYSYLANGNLGAITDQDGKSIASFVFNNADQLVQKTLGNGAYTTYDYDAVGRVIQATNFSAAGAVLSQFDYTYDANGRCLTETTLQGVWTYTYDGSSRMIGAVFKSADTAVVSDQNLSFTYDAVGNRTSVVHNGVTTAYASNKLNQYSAAGATVFSYDADGNMLSQTDGVDTTTYEYDALNRVTKIVRGADTWVYQYNAVGLQTAIVKNGVLTRCLVDPTGMGNLFGEYDQDNQLVKRYAHGSGLVAEAGPSGDVHYFGFDALGNASVITDASGVVERQISYFPFGETLYNQGAFDTRFGFGGELGAFTDAGLVFMRNRHYSPAIGRFLSADPIRFKAQRYAYAENCPKYYIDPVGLENVRTWTDAEIRQNLRDVVNYERENGTAATSAAFNPTWHGSESHKTLNMHAPSRFGSVDMDWFFTLTHFTRPTCAAGGGIAGAIAGSFIGGPVGFVVGGVVGAGFGYVFPNPAGAYIVGKIGWAFVDHDCFWGHIKAIGNKEELIALAMATLVIYGVSMEDVFWLFGIPVGSQDPNQKVGPGGYGENHYVNAGAPLAYRVDFENRSTATAPAQVVTITDPLDANLDWETLEITEVAFGDHIISVPDNSRSFQCVEPMTYNGKNLNVNISIKIDQAGQVVALFDTVDPETGLPPSVDYGFLPPEDGTGRGQGHVSFTIYPKAGLATGTEIRNVADINFDFSYTIATNQVSPDDPTPDPTKECPVTIDATKPTSSVPALPAKSPVNFIVSWSGSDAEAGIQNYTVYVQDNGGAFAPWLSGTTATSSVFHGENGHTYGFYSVAVDNVGNVEAAKTAAEATTLADSGTTTLPVVTTSTIAPYGSARKSGGDVLIDGGAGVTVRGVCWSIFHDPTIVNAKSADGSGVGTFESLIDGLQPNNTYYVRAYATNSVGTAYGEERSFQTSTADKLLLTVQASPAEGGTVTPSGQIEVDSNTAINIAAVAANGYVFVGWAITDGDAIITLPTSAATTVTLYANATATARFINELLANPMPKIAIQLDNAVATKDTVSIAKATLPTLPSGYNPATDAVSVFVDEHEFIIDPTTWKPNSKGTVFTAKSAKETGPLATTLTLDLTKKIWTFKATKATISQEVDNSDGVFILLQINGKIYGELFPMDENVKWTGVGDEARLIGLGGTPMTSFSLKGSKLKGSYAGYSTGKDSFSIEKALLKLPGAFVPTAASSLLVKRLNLNLGPYTKSGSKEVYSYKSGKGVAPVINSTIDLTKGVWSVKMSKGDCANIVNGGGEGLDVILTLGEYRDGVKVEAYRKTKLTYSP